VTEVQKYDLALIGGGIMSATLGVLVKLVSPKTKIVIFERLDEVALESSNPWNNAGTGHAALCELNYMPDSTDGSLPDPSKAIAINEQFQVSRQLWSFLVEKGVLGDPETFIRSVPHITFVESEKDIDYLRRRFESLKDQPLFSGLEYTEFYPKLSNWVPLMASGREGTRFAATRIEQGTDVDYGTMTSQMINWLVSEGVELRMGTEVKSLHQFPTGDWQLWLGNYSTDFLHASKVFVGAGGWALKLLQSSGIDEIKGYGTFPVSGHFFRTDNPDLVRQHRAKVYSQAQVGAPPMSVPHLDTRVVDGKESLLFGPFAGINPKFLKQGSVLDLPLSIRPANVIPYLSVALKNFGLVKYLLTEVTKSKKQKFASLRSFVPLAEPKDWTYYEAGQRAQVIKPVQGGGVLQFGTEVISSKDGSISGLLGASPGASVSVSVMLEVMQRMYGPDYNSFEPRLAEMIPSYGKNLNENASLARRVLAATAQALKLKA
jgi:malate dehydrogenase (quinone)